MTAAAAGAIPLRRRSFQNLPEQEARRGHPGKGLFIKGRLPHPSPSPPKGMPRRAQNVPGGNPLSQPSLQTGSRDKSERRMVMHTRFTHRFGVPYPIMQALMAYAAGPRLVAAVANAGDVVRFMAEEARQ